MAKAQQTPLYRPVPHRLRAIRQSSGLTQRDLAARLHRRHSWVYGCETAARRVDIAEFAAWCRACGTDPVAAFRGLIDELPPDLPRLATRGKSKQSGPPRRARQGARPTERRGPSPG